MTENWVPAACTLPTAERPVRLAEFDDLLSYALGVSRPDPRKLDIVIPRIAEKFARGLTARESMCCSFFSFEFRAQGGEVLMQIAVPTEHLDVLDGIERRLTNARRVLKSSDARSGYRF